MKEVKKQEMQMRRWKKVTLYMLGVIIILLITPVVLNKIIQTTVKKNLEQLSPVVDVAYSSIQAHLFTSTLSIKDLAIKFQPDTMDHDHQHVLTFSEADFKGISFLRAVFNKKLFISKLRLEKGNLKLDQSLLDKKDSLQRELSARMPFDEISIGRFEIAEGNVSMNINGQNKLLAKGTVGFDDMVINNSGMDSANNFHFSGIQCDAKDISYTLPDSDQVFMVKLLQLNSRQQSLKIDSLKLLEKKKDNKSYGTVAFFSGIHISKLDVMKLFDRKFIAGNIIVSESQVNIFNDNPIFKSPENPAIPVFDSKRIPDEVSIDSFVITQSAITCESISEDDLESSRKFLDSAKLKNFSINHFVIAKSDVRIHSKNESQFKVDKMVINNLSNPGNGNPGNGNPGYSSVECNLSDIHYAMPNRRVRINRLMADSRKALLRIDAVSVSTPYSKYEFGKKLGRQADYIEATVPRIEISKLNFDQLLNKKLVADKMTVYNSKIYFFRDRRLPRQLKKQPMPNGYLEQIPVEVRVNTFEINNASILSEEFPKVGDQAGYLQIENVNISMSPMLNHPYKSDPMYSDTYVEGSIMNAGLIKATIRAPLRENIYSIKGVIKNLDLPKLNPSAENLGRFHIESGVLNFLDFHFTATEEKATGKIIGEYHDLLIDRLKAKGGEKEVAKVPSFFLKHVIIPKNKDESLPVAKRTGKIDYKRDTTRVVTFYFLKALLDGIRASFDLGFVLPK